MRPPAPRCDLRGLDGLGEALARLLDRTALVVAEARRQRAAGALAPFLDLRRIAVVVALRVRAEAIRRGRERTEPGLTDAAGDGATGRSWTSSTSVVSSASASTPNASAGRDRAGELQLDRRRLRVVVVLDDEEQAGQRPERGDVQRLVRDALAEGAVAEEHGRDGARPFAFSASAIPVATGTMLPSTPFE